MAGVAAGAMLGGRFGLLVGGPPGASVGSVVGGTLGGIAAASTTRPQADDLVQSYAINNATSI